MKMNNINNNYNKKIELIFLLSLLFSTLLELAPFLNDKYGNSSNNITIIIVSIINRSNNAISV